MGVQGPPDDASANWFTGFTDGEGSFMINKGTTGLIPVFEITQTASERILLRRLREWFGGQVYGYEAHKHKTGPYTSRPSAMWLVRDADGLLALVKHFDAFPLRTDRRRQYEVWREAVLVYKEKGKDAPELVEARETLRTLRPARGDARLKRQRKPSPSDTP